MKVGKVSPEPEVTLINYFASPYDNSVAAARTCYSSKVIYPKDVSKDEKARNTRDKIFDSIFEAKHHTTIQHPTFQFVLRNVSRQFLWSFLHSHPYYNSEQVSQRYVEVKPENFVTPPLDQKASRIYSDTIKMQMSAYFKLMELIDGDVRREYFRIYPSRKKDTEKWESNIHKKVIEAARYCLPVATTAHLYHTISGVTLYRYARISEQFDTPLETRLVVQKMVDEVNKVDPLFLKKFDDPIPLDQTLEYKVFEQFRDHSPLVSDGAAEFVKEFDSGLGEFISKLIDWKVKAEETMASSVRTVLGVASEKLPDADAIRIVLDPASNNYLSESLTLLTLSKLGRSLEHPHYTFRKKVSHTADSQDQRHRMVPGTRPIMMAHYISSKPDYIIPQVIGKNAAALEFFDKVAQETWSSINSLLESGVRWEFAQYLLPNAFPIRFEESGALMDLHHKWTTRLCYLAQEEIWRSCVEEVMQVQKVHPTIAEYLVAPCGIRKRAGASPFCPEGNRYCGIPVWDLSLDEYSRFI